MKYWIFQNNQVNGPYEPDDLSQLPGYSAETLVCPEGRKGTRMGDWQRAGVVSELSLSLAKASQVATSVSAPSAGSYYTALPPEPTLKDLAALGSLQEKVSILESTLSQFQEGLRLKDSELLSLHRELEDKSLHARELAVKLGMLEERLSSLSNLRENLEKAVAAEQDIESMVTKQSQAIGDLAREIIDLKSQVKERGPAPAEMISPAPTALAVPEAFAAPAAPEAVAPAPELSFAAKPEVPAEAVPPAFKPLEEVPAPAPPVAAETAAPLSMPPWPAPQPLESLAQQPPAVAPSFGAPDAGQAFAAASETTPAASFPFGAPLGEPQEAPPPPQTAPPLAVPFPEGLEAIPLAPEPAFEVPAAVEGPKPGGKKLILAALGLALLAGAGLAFKAGLIPLGKNPELPAVSDRTPLAPPALPAPEPPKPPTPTPEEQAEAMKQTAVNLVKSWPSPVGMKTVGQLLEGEAPQAGALSPWMSEKVKEDIYQVNFYAPKSAQAPARTYEFEVHVGDMKVFARNDAAQELLSAKEPPAAPVNPPRPKRRKARVKPRRNVSQEFDELIGGGKEAASQQRQKQEETLDQLLMPGGTPKPAPEEPKPARAKSPKAADADLLDDLLKP